MYFPIEITEIRNEIKDVRNILHSLHNRMSDNEKIAIIDSCTEKIEQLSSRFSLPGEWEQILEDLRNVRRRCKQSTMEVDEFKYIFADVSKKISLLIHSDVKPYKNLCIFFLSHPRNKATVTAEILSRINYLDKMTRDVTFIMPGYKRAQLNDEVINESDNNLQLTFDENLFIKIVQELENESNGKFLYNDMCELVFIGIKSNGEYDFDNFQRLDLNILSQKRGIDPIKLILTVAQQFRTNKNDTIEIKKYVTQILGELTMQDYNPAIKIFIAGAKKLREERSLLREELSKVENTHNLDIRSLTFEDFATCLTGEDRGRQADYNKFIEKEANVVVFIFDCTAGEITEEEFDIAYNSLKENKHPDIFVYVRKRSPFSLRSIFGDRRLQKIKNKIFAYQKEYYIEYENLNNLRYLFYSDMVSYFIKKEEK